MLKKYIIIVDTREYKKMYTIETDDISALYGIIGKSNI